MSAAVAPQPQEFATPAVDPVRVRNLRLLVIGFALVELALFVWFWVYVIGKVNPRGGGFELIALGPATMLYGLTGFPALLIGFISRNQSTLRWAIVLLATCAILGLFYTNAIVNEFAANAAAQ